MRQAIFKGKIVSFLIMKDKQSIKKLDGTVVEGNPGDIMVSYADGEGDILSPQQFTGLASSFESTPITPEVLEEMNAEDLAGRR